MVLDTDSLVASISECDGTDTISFTIKNSGDDSLIFRISNIPYYIGVSNTFDTIAMGDSMEIEVHFYGDMPVATYNYPFFINTNEAGEPRDTINTTFSINGDPSVAISGSVYNFG